MKSIGRSGFTLLEVLLATVVLALTATAALKLAMMAQKTLSVVKAKEALLSESQKLEIDLELKNIDRSGHSGDYSWKTEEREKEILNEHLGELNFSADKETETSVMKWREFTVSDKKNNKITFCIAVEDETMKDANSEDISIVKDKDNNK